MNEIYVVGGQVRTSLFRKLEEWQSCKKALVIAIDPETNKSRTCLEYVSPPGARAGDSAAIQFKSATVQNGKLYLCTSTEVLIYQVPGFRQAAYISLPCFNDLHHVSPTPRGTLLVVVTGLDMVIEITIDGRILREWNVLGEDPWAGFSREIDYRRVATTKPHRSHPNHVFQLGEEIWVTRFEQRDAISLTQPGRRIDIGVQRPHDGLLFGDSIYFSTVDGHLVLADQSSLKLEQILDVNQMAGKHDRVLGWCRGLWPLDQRHVWMGFTHVRPTRFKENVAWIKGNADRFQPTHLALYDIERRVCLQEVELEPHGIGVVFSLLSAG